MYRWVVIGGALGFLAVAAGAFGAHALKGALSDDKLSMFETAARYQIYHALVLVAIGIAGSRRGGNPDDVAAGVARRKAPMPGTPSAAAPKTLSAAGWCFTLGVVIFSGSLYAYALGGGRGFAIVTPIGGVMLLSGWVCMVAWGLGQGRSNSAQAVDIKPSS